MEEQKKIYTEVECAKNLAAVEDALYVLGGKWKLRIVIALVSGYHRFNEIQRTIHGISARLLSNELKSLEMNGLVKRVERSDLKPATIEYLPTDYAETLKEMVDVMGNWGRKHKERITGKATKDKELFES